MKNSIATLLDSYKISHKWQYPEGIEKVYSNWTIRGSRIEGLDNYVFFGLQYFIKEYLIKRWNEEFFNLPKEEALFQLKKSLKNSLNIIDVSHYEELHDLGYLPILIKALPEGSIVPLKVPCFTIVNTNPKFFWITNMLETIASCTIWGMINNATVSYRYAGIRRKYLSITDNISHPLEQFLNHNFGYRGMFTNEAGITSDAAWLLFSKGSDTVPGIQFMEEYYNADSDKEIISMSIPATEHSVTCAGGKDNEEDTYLRMINMYKNATKIFSFVSDSWDYWNFLDNIVRKNKDILINSGCRCVFRPDSSPKTPYEIICGDSEAEIDSPEYKGSLELLWEIFGGTYNEKGYRVLNSCCGLIYGEAISPELYEKILSKMVDMKFCITNLVVGIGSFSQTYTTRDTLKQAFKATAVKINGEWIDIFKDPKTDTSGKKSAKGLLAVFKDENNEFYLKDQCSKEEEQTGELKVVYENGKLIKDWTFQEIKQNLNK